MNVSTKGHFYVYGIRRCLTPGYVSCMWERYMSRVLYEVWRCGMGHNEIDGYL